MTFRSSFQFVWSAPPCPRKGGAAKCIFVSIASRTVTEQFASRVQHVIEIDIRASSSWQYSTSPRAQHFGLKVDLGFSQIDQVNPVCSRGLSDFRVEIDPDCLMCLNCKLMGQQNCKVKIALGVLPDGPPTAEAVYRHSCREGGRNGFYYGIHFTYFGSNVSVEGIAPQRVGITPC